MSKLALQVKNRRRQEIVARYAERRAELKARIIDPALDAEQRTQAVRALARLPRDSAAVRLRHRDAIDGRPRGYVRRAGVSRVRFRELAHRGELPGITKSSW